MPDSNSFTRSEIEGEYGIRTKLSKAHKCCSNRWDKATWIST